MQSLPQDALPRALRELPAHRRRYSFSQPWFDNHRQDWEDLTPTLRGRRLDILEIGSFEGASTTWFLDYLATHPDSRVIAVDTFKGGGDHRPEEGTDYQLNSLERRFLENVRQCENYAKLRQLKMDSRAAAVALRHEGAKFDFIYIDGSHAAGDVIHDAVVTWPMLRVGGRMVFDDFRWRMYVQEHYNPGIAIATFMRCYANELRGFERGGQVWITKYASFDTPQRFNNG